MKTNEIKVVFLGTPEFAVPTLELLADTKYKPLLVVTQPDKKQGRNMRLSSSPVKQVSIEHDIEIMQPEDINEEYVIDRITYLQPDVIVTVAYGGFLKKELLKLPAHGCINLHPSLLPKYRGAAPVNYALFNNDKLTGNTVIKMVKKMDSGPILHVSKMEIDDNDNATVLSEKLAQQGALDILNVLEQIASGTVKQIDQNEAEATYSHKITKEDIVINWQQDASQISSKVRGLADEPGAAGFFRENRIKVLETKVLGKKTTRQPGTILAVGELSSYQNDLPEKGIVVATGGNDLLIKTLQPSGKKKMSAFDFNLGARIKPGERFKS